MAQRTIQAINPDLFELALLYLGDATQWNRIAEASGTGTDPYPITNGIITLTIPDSDNNAGGGIYGN